MLLCNLDEIAPRVVEHRCGDRPHRRRRLCEPHASRAKPVKFGLDIIDIERREGNAVIDQRSFERPYRGMSIRLQQ